MLKFKQTRISTTLSQILLITMGALLLSSSCARVKIKDEDIYGDKGADGAVEVHLLSEGQADIPKAVWDKLRFGMACISRQALGDLKAEIMELCSYSNDCDYEVQQNIQAFFDKMEELNKVVMP
jgi:hypothetical protein